MNEYTTKELQNIFTGEVSLLKIEPIIDKSNTYGQLLQIWMIMYILSIYNRNKRLVLHKDLVFEMQKYAVTRVWVCYAGRVTTSNAPHGK